MGLSQGVWAKSPPRLPGFTTQPLASRSPEGYVGVRWMIGVAEPELSSGASKRSSARTPGIA
jgi:hypothetical protein